MNRNPKYKLLCRGTNAIVIKQTIIINVIVFNLIALPINNKNSYVGNYLNDKYIIMVKIIEQDNADHRLIKLLYTGLLCA